MIPVIDSSAGMIPPRKMTTCQTGPIPVPSCQRRMVRAIVSGFTPFITTLLFEWIGWMGPALLFSTYMAIGLWAALATRETWGPRERRLADDAVANSHELAA